MREDAGSEEDDRLRDEREDHRVAQCSAEVLALPGFRVVLEADELTRQRARSGVRKAEIHGENERSADQQDDEEDRRSNQERAEEAALLENVLPAPTL